MSSRYQRKAGAAAHPFDDVPDLPCRTDDPDAWFPEPSDPGARGRTARDVCRTLCGIREACLAFALSTGQTYGTWGGMTAGKRAEMTDLQQKEAVAAGAARLREIGVARRAA